MLEIDQFESTFKAATREVYRYERYEVPHVMVLTDLPEDEAERFTNEVKGFLGVLDESTWSTVSGTSADTVTELLEKLNANKPSMVCTYRHLHSDAWKWPYSLGTFVDILTQAADCPVMLLPRPSWIPGGSALPKDTNEVTAITDHMTGDDRLVNKAARLTAPNGTLFLTHVEDQVQLDRYLDIIEKIPDLDTDTAKATIKKRLLKEPADYIASCKQVLGEKKLTLKVEPHVTSGHTLAEYERLIGEHGIDLLVMHGRDDQQVAMHGLAYPLAIELRTTPMLLIR